MHLRRKWSQNGVCLGIKLFLYVETVQNVMQNWVAISDTGMVHLPFSLSMAEKIFSPFHDNGLPFFALKNKESSKQWLTIGVTQSLKSMTTSVQQKIMMTTFWDEDNHSSRFPPRWWDYYSNYYGPVLKDVPHHLHHRCYGKNPRENSRIPHHYWWASNLLSTGNIEFVRFNGSFISIYKSGSLISTSFPKQKFKKWQFVFSLTGVVTRW